jgi:hypothetical protein
MRSVDLLRVSPTRSGDVREKKHYVHVVEFRARSVIARVLALGRARRGRQHQQGDTAISHWIGSSTITGNDDAGVCWP